MSEIQEFPPEILEKIEEVKAIRRSVLERYMETGQIDETAFARIHVLLQQASEYIFDRFPVVFMRRQTYIMPAPASANGIRLFMQEGYELVLPPALEGKSLEEIAEIQKQNLPRLIPVGQLLVVDAEYLFYLEAYLRSNEASFVKEKLENAKSMDVEKPEIVKQEETEEFVSTNISQKKKRKLKGGEV